MPEEPAPRLSSQDRRVALGIAVTTLLVGVYVSRAILSANHGTPALALDDSYIHLQYARALARGAPLEYSLGAPSVAGSTSWLWPLLLAPWAALGSGGAALIWPTWLLAWSAYGLLAWETYRATADLLGNTLRLWLVVLTCGFGGHLWFAGSGMEGVPFAWLLLRSARRAADWHAARDRVRLAELLLLAWLCPLMRPEGFLASLLIAATLVISRPRRHFGWALVALLGPCLPALGNLVFGGELATTTQRVKWLPSSPYQSDGRWLGSLLANLRLLFGSILNGDTWSAEFLPQQSALAFWLALPALVLLGALQRQRWRALCLAFIGLGLLLPTAYETFLWNRLRYLWPFIVPWFVGVGAELEFLGRALQRFSPRLRALQYVVAAVVACAVLERAPLCIRDLAESARAISAQQVSLGVWARAHLPSDARIGVNDTGAIAYFSERRTFDVVGLTTRGEAAYWVAGAGSRFEHYERLAPSELPTHFIVYPHWFALAPLLGPELTRRSVPYATILGGETMVAYTADYSALASAERPLEFPDSRIVDQLDVADLESEREHAYELFDARQVDDQIVEAFFGGPVDGARHARFCERFELRLGPRARLIARLGAVAETALRVTLDGREVAVWQLRAEPWQEWALSLGPEAPASDPNTKQHETAPADAATANVVRVVELSADHSFSALHYWSVADP